MFTGVMENEICFALVLKINLFGIFRVTDIDCAEKARHEQPLGRGEQK